MPHTLYLYMSYALSVHTQIFNTCLLLCYTQKIPAVVKDTDVWQLPSVTTPLVLSTHHPVSLRSTSKAPVLQTVKLIALQILSPILISFKRYLKQTNKPVQSQGLCKSDVNTFYGNGLLTLRQTHTSLWTSTGHIRSSPAYLGPTPICWKFGCTKPYV